MTPDQIRAARMRFEVTLRVPKAFKIPRCPPVGERLTCTVCLSQTGWTVRYGYKQTIYGWCRQCNTRQLLCDR